MRLKDLPEVFKILTDEYSRFKTPAVTVVSEETRDPFRVLVSCILSLRTKDQVTAEAGERLFAVASDPEGISKLTPKRIEKLIYPVGFYRNKAQQIRDISKELVEDYSSKVPDTIEGLLHFKGVGRKTANLVMTLGYGLPGICVDIHVHRITNRWGFVSTSAPDKTEFALREKLPEEYWIPINDLLVAYGQNLCKPVSPFCSKCQILKFCDRVGVASSR
jgi:endonuclease-3